jgi:serine protease Do
MHKFIAVALVVLISSSAFAQVKKTREEKLRDDRAKHGNDGLWIYNDLPKAFEIAKKNGKPILVVLRCIPCEECVKLDDELMDRDPAIRPLLDKFVCVRQVSTNGLDLTLFQFDTDQSFAVFMLNADKTIYGRFGTRSHRTEWLGDVSLPGMAKALQGALSLHEQYPANKSALSGKRGTPWETTTPEKLPSLKDRYSNKWNSDVRSCIHCHQIGEARRNFYRQAAKPIPERILFPTSHPKVIGLTLDPEEKATVKSIQRGSAAAKSAMRAGDRIIAMDGQPMLSIADVQWVLDSVDPAGGSVDVTVQRGLITAKLNMKLEAGWRRTDDLSWRASSWALRRMVTGGLLLETLNEEGRAGAKIENGAMALRVKHVGQYGEHAAAKRAGFRKEDVLIEFDGRHDLGRETDLFFHAATKTKPGDRIPVTVLRNGRAVKLTLPMQK